MLKFVQCAQTHPPGAILMFFFIKQLMSAFPVLGNIASSSSPTHVYGKLMWENFLPSEKATAIFSYFKFAVDVKSSLYKYISS